MELCCAETKNGDTRRKSPRCNIQKMKQSHVITSFFYHILFRNTVCVFYQGFIFKIMSISSIHLKLQWVWKAWSLYTAWSLLCSQAPSQKQLFINLSNAFLCTFLWLFAMNFLIMNSSKTDYIVFIGVLEPCSPVKKNIFFLWPPLES